MFAIHVFVYCTTSLANHSVNTHNYPRTGPSFLRKAMCVTHVINCLLRYNTAWLVTLRTHIIIHELDRLSYKRQWVPFMYLFTVTKLYEPTQLSTYRILLWKAICVIRVTVCHVICVHANYRSLLLLNDSVTDDQLPDCGWSLLSLVTSSSSLCDSCHCLPCGICTSSCRSLLLLLKHSVTDDQLPDCGSRLLSSSNMCVIPVTVYHAVHAHATADHYRMIMWLMINTWLWLKSPQPGDQVLQLLDPTQQHLNLLARLFIQSWKGAGMTVY